MFPKSILCWRNRFSGEEGYVLSVSPKKGYFESTKDRTKAKVYVNNGLFQKDMLFLNSIGETNQNEFYLIQIA